MGVSKTRLARGVGDTVAAAFAQAFLDDTVANLERIGQPFTIATTEPEAAAFTGLRCVDQGGGGLGERLQRVLAEGLRSNPRVAALGADSPGLPDSLLQDAMRGSDAAIIPSSDGGFVLIALSSCPDGLFADLPWSQPHTCEAMVLRLRDRGQHVRILAPWFDVDHAEDLTRLALLPAERIPATRAVLESCTTTGPEAP